MGIDPPRASRATIQASQEYGTCSVCSRGQRLTARGTLYQHQKRDRYGYATGEQCDGAGQPPKAD